MEKILDCMKSKGKTYYLVKWEGYDDSDNSWEEKKNLESCLELIKEFNEE